MLNVFNLINYRLKAETVVNYTLTRNRSLRPPYQPRETANVHHLTKGHRQGIANPVPPFKSYQIK